MPNFCVFQNKLTTPDDIYKHGFDKNSEFMCYTCNKRLHFRQSRNGDKDYTEHFYHQNTIKDTHIECENDTYEKVKKETSVFHNMFSKFVKDDCKEILRTTDCKKHIVDGYDKEHNMGVEFQNSQISVDDIISRDKTTELDWIFNVENKYIRVVNIGNMVVCEIPHENWEQAVKVVQNNVFLYTGCKGWIWLSDRKSYRVEIENKIRNVWIGELCSFQDVLDNTCLQYIIKDEGIQKFNNLQYELVCVSIMYARCKKTMVLLDDIHRNYIANHNFNTNDVVAIKSVAGSGKTTTLLNLTKIHNNKRVLYIAFNKSLITEMKDKIKHQNIKNMFPFTFDALLYKLYMWVKGSEPELTNLRPQFIGKIIPFLDDKPFKVREYYCKKFNQFCNDVDNNDIRSFCFNKLGSKKPLLEQMWDKATQGKIITFESIRKQAYINSWFKRFIDSEYDLIMIDETQDFDMLMLKMLLNDTTIPKIFVGDPMQSIYDFRGCINAFKHLPKNALIVEFYSTFRVGYPACDSIISMFDKCWMISKSKNETNIVSSFECNENYVYLFRSWRFLLQTAEKTKNIWIYNFDKKMNEICLLHKKLQHITYTDDEEDAFEDDLPMFLKTLSLHQLNAMLNNIRNNLVSFEDSIVKFYTIHSYKGMEHNNIRLANDIDIYEDENLYYVAITRGMQKILIDE